MAKLLLSKEVNTALRADLKLRCESLAKEGIVPTLGVIRIGKKPEDEAYIAGMERCFGSVGAGVEIFEFDEHSETEEIVKEIKKIGDRNDIHAMLLLKPLPKGLDERAISDAVPPEKDADAVSRQLMPAAYLGETDGFLPCTAAAVTRGSR